MEIPLRLTRTVTQKQSKKKMSAETFFVWTIVAGTLTFFAAFFYYPFLATIFDTFFTYDYITPRKFVGLKNFTDLLSDSNAYTAFKNTFAITGVAVPFTIAIALVLAMIVFRMKIASGLFRALLFATSIIPTVIAGLVFRALFDENNGFINSQLIAFGFKPIPWLTDPGAAMAAIIILTIWRSIGFYMVIFLAGLSNIHAELYEAAMIDGASSSARFFYVTIPQLRYSLVFCGIIAVINGLSSYEQVYVLTQGGPYRSTITAALYMFDLTVRSSRVGYASVIALVLFVIMAVVSVYQLHFTGTYQD